MRYTLGRVARNPTRVFVQLSNAAKHSRLATYVVQVSVATLAYFLLATFGLSFQSMGKFASLVWPSAGVSLAGLLLMGRKYWPAILLGEFLANAASGAAPGVALAMGAGNALDAVISVTFLRMTDFDDKFVRVKDVLLFAGLGIILSAVISPTFGVTSLWLGGVVSDANYWTVWAVWYTGNLISILELTPLILIWRQPWKFMAWTPWTRLEFAALVCVSILIGFGSFLNSWHVSLEAVPILLYPVFLPVFWAVRRFGRHGATLNSFILASFAVWGTLTGQTPFHLQSGGILVSDVIQLALYFSAVGLAGLIVSTAYYEQRKAEMMSYEAMQKLDAANKAKDEFLATLAHELRNPLAPLSSSVQRLQFHAEKSNEVSDKRRIIDRELEESVQTAARQIHNMTRLLDDLLDVSRLNRGKFNLRIEDVDMRDVAKHAVETVNPILQAHRHAFSATFPHEPMMVRGDPLRLEQIVVNLLNNSAKYTAPGGTIQLALMQQANTICMSVKDNGRGLAEEDLPMIFDSFGKADRAQDPGYGGLGLGLQLVKRITEMHGGKVHAYSEGLGRGSLFLVQFPALVDYKPPAVPERPHQEPIRHMQQRKILIVDDNIDAADSLKRLLELEGHVVKTANDGAFSLIVAGEYTPEVVLLDIGMPGMDGYQVARALRQKKFGGMIVALTGYGQADDRSRSKEAGIDHHLLKPATLDSLRKILAE